MQATAARACINEEALLYHYKLEGMTMSNNTLINTVTGQTSPRGARVPVSRDALIKRINRRLPEDEVVRVTRGERERSHLGDYWIHNVFLNYPAATDIDLETVARELGAMRDAEYLADDPDD